MHTIRSECTAAGMLTKAHGAWPRKGAHQAVSTPSCNAAQPFAASCNKAQGSATHVRARVASRGRAPEDGIAAARATVALSAHNSEPCGKMTVTFVLCRTASAARNAPNSINLKTPQRDRRRDARHAYSHAGTQCGTCRKRGSLARKSTPIVSSGWRFDADSISIELRASGKVSQCTGRKLHVHAFVRK